VAVVAWTADYSLTDKQGTRLTLVDGVYIHHIIVSDAAPVSGTTTLLAATPSWLLGLSMRAACRR
jgi:hypothetical protein